MFTAWYYKFDLNFLHFLYNFLIGKLWYKKITIVTGGWEIKYKQKNLSKQIGNCNYN